MRETIVDSVERRAVSVHVVHALTTTCDLFYSQDRILYARHPSWNGRGVPQGVGVAAVFPSEHGCFLSAVE